MERNDALHVEDVLAGGWDAILLSPGPGTPENAGISIGLAGACIERGLPLLGVCLGHQAIAAACGHDVDRVAPVHGKSGALRHDGSGLFTGLPSPFLVTRYHSLAIGRTAPPLIATAWSDDGVIMGLRHETAPVYGVQFHPESVASEHGHRLLENFLELANQAIRA